MTSAYFRSQILEPNEVAALRDVLAALCRSRSINRNGREAEILGARLMRLFQSGRIDLQALEDVSGATRHAKGRHNPLHRIEERLNGVVQLPISAA